MQSTPFMKIKSKRRSRRIPSRLAVRVMRRGAWVTASAGDINEHGVFIRTEVKAWPGELLQFVIDLPDGPMNAFVVARFIGTTETGVGIGAEFYNLAEVDRVRWSRHFRAELRGLTEPDTVETGRAPSRPVAVGLQP
jgi:hypothetical protein